MNTVFAIVSLLIYVKGLGGSFNSSFNHFGIGEYHGPAMGFLLGLSLVLFFCTSLNRKNAAFIDKERKRRRDEGFSFLYIILVCFGMYVHTKAVLNTPIDVGRADMLPAIQAQIHAAGQWQSPYKAIPNSNGQPVVHGYFPMLWMSYFPLEIAHLDLRWVNLLAQLVFYLLLLDLFLHHRGPLPSKFWVSGGLLLVLLALHLFSKQSIRGPIDLHTGPFWLFSALFYWAVLTERQTFSLWLAPFLVLCREPAILMLLPFIIHLFFTNRRQFFKGLSIGIVMGLLITSPFLISSPSDFFRGVFFYSKHVYQTPLSDMMKFYGFSGILYKFNLLSWQQPLQLVGTCFALIISFLKRKTLTVAGVLGLGGIAYLNIIILASLTYQFLYIELIQLVLLICFGTYSVNPRPKNK